MFFFKKFFPSFLMVLIFTASIYASSSNYVVGPGDALDIDVYDNKDLSVSVQISGDGKIRFPLIGEIQVQGKTISQISEEIEKKLADGYLVNPQVSIIVKEYRSRKATILGQVEKPALYELRGKTTLLELISQAEGITDKAGKYAYITRIKSNGGGKNFQEVLKINLKQLIEAGDTSQNILIKNGDSIFISEMEKIYVTGEVKKPSAYRYDEDMTLIKVITNAGGLTDKADPNRVKIIREKNGKKEVIEKSPMDAAILPDDVIVIPQSFF